MAIDWGVAAAYAEWAWGNGAAPAAPAPAPACMTELYAPTPLDINRAYSIGSMDNGAWLAAGPGSGCPAGPGSD